MAIDALKYVGQLSWRSAASSSTSASGGGPCAAVPMIRWRSSGDRLPPARSAAVATDSCTATTPSPKRSASARAISVPSVLSRAPTSVSVAGCPAWIAAVNPLGMMNATLRSPASTGATASASVATSAMSATPASAIDPMTSSRRTRASAPRSRSATIHFVEKSVAEASSWLKMIASPSGATTEMSSAERSRTRWRRSLAAMSRAWRTGFATRRCREARDR